MQKKARTTRLRIHARGSDESQQFQVEQNDSSDHSEDSNVSSSAKKAGQPSPKIRKSIIKTSQLEIRKTRPSSSEVPLQSLNQVPRASRGIREKLAADDAEIEALEKVLGIKGNRKLPKGFEDDGLDSLLTGLDSSGDEADLQLGKRKRREGEEWLESKRRKALQNDASDDDSTSRSDDGSGTSRPLDDDGESLLSDSEEASEKEVPYLEDFGGFDSGKGYPDSKQPRVRENPYEAPSAPTGTPSTTKYIPPSLRAAKDTESEDLGRLRRQIQGLLNRLSEANILSILNDIEKLYQNNPRHHISAILIDLLMGLLSDPTVLQDTFLILHAGFIAGVYKIIGTDFGALVVQKVVEEFDGIYQTQMDGGVSGKKLTNLISLLAEMYNFQVVGSGLIYDFVRIFLGELCELNAELLLRIIRSKFLTPLLRSILTPLSIWTPVTAKRSYSAQEYCSTPSTGCCQG